MKKIQGLMLLLILFPMTGYATDWHELFNTLTRIYGVNLDIKKIDQSSLEELRKFSASQSGTHHYGNLAYDSDSFTWGADNWQSLLALSRSGAGSGEMGQAISRLIKDFPIEKSLESTNETENKYYQLQAQNALAARAASEVSYAQAVKEEKTIRALQNEIDKAPDAKSAADLNNRLIAENASINVQQTKLLAVLASQAALAEQERVNRAKEDKEFFSTK